MAQWQIALLRGINTGKANRIGMADLRALVEGLGFAEVRTLLNSGNIVFKTGSSTADAVASRIERALATRLGVSCRVIVITGRQLATIIAENPLLAIARNPSRLLVAFLADPAERSRLAPLLDDDWGAEALGLGSLAAYLWLPDGVIPSRLNPAVDKALGGKVTSRNWATVLKLKDMVQEG